MSQVFPIFAAMKRPVLIGLLLLLVFAACHTPTREARRMLARAERLADTLPDSTLRLIDSVMRMEAYLSERKRMDMALLQGEVLFRDASVDDDDVLDSIATIPELERAAAYYAKKKQYARAAHAALYSGYVQQHYNEKDVAMQSFKDAEHYGQFVDDSLTMSWSEYQIGKMLLNDGMYKEALTLLISAESGFSNLCFENSLVQNMLACIYLLMDDFANAEACLEKSLSLAMQCPNSEAKKKTLNNYAVLYQQTGKYGQAVECLRQVVVNCDTADILIAYLNLGNAFVAKGEFDSAAYYYKQVEDALPASNLKMETKVSAYGLLFRFAEKQGNTSQALAYHKEYENCLYAVMRQRQEQSVYRIQQQYNYETLQNAMNKKIIQRHRIIVIISVLLFVLAFLLMIVQYRQKQLLKAEEEMKLQIDTMKQELQQSVKSSMLEQEVFSRLQMILTAVRISQRANDPQCVWKPLVWQVMSDGQTAFDASRTVIEMAYPNLYALIRDKHPELSETEAKICMLSFTELSNAEMAELLGLRPNTVNQNRSTLRKKLNLNSNNKMKEQLQSAFSN